MGNAAKLMLDSGWTVECRKKPRLYWPGWREFLSRFWYYYVERTHIFQYRLPLFTAVRLSAEKYRDELRAE